MLDSLRNQRDVISLEAFTVADTTRLLSRVFPSMVSKLSGFVERFNADNPTLDLKSDQKDFLTFIGKFNFMDIEKVAISVPEGFKGKLLPYSEDLKAAAQHVVDIQEKVLSPFAKYLALLVSRSDQRLDTSDFTVSIRKYITEREAASKLISKNFTGSEVVGGSIKVYLDRNADWAPIFKNTNDINKIVNSVDRTDLNKQAKGIVELLDVILVKIKRGELDNVSPEVTNTLGENVYQVAAELEYFSYVYFKALELSASLDRSIQSLKKNLS